MPASNRNTKLIAHVPANLDRDIRDRLWLGLSDWGELAIADAKDNAPVAFASGTAPFGWVLSYQASGQAVKPKGRVQGGTLRRATFMRRLEAALQLKFGATASYLLPIHEGTAHFEGRPYIAEAIFRNIAELRTILERELLPDFI